MTRLSYITLFDAIGIVYDDQYSCFGISCWSPGW